MNQKFLQAEPKGGIEANPRKAALLLHSMPSCDQEWLLKQLPVHQAEILLPLLNDLRELGIPADPELLCEVALTPPVNPLPKATHNQARELSVEAQIAALEAADCQLLCRILHDEPAGLIARVLELNAWPWTGDLLQRLSPVKRAQVAQQQSILPRGYETVSRPEIAGETLKFYLISCLNQRLANLTPFWHSESIYPLKSTLESGHRMLKRRWWRRWLPNTGTTFGGEKI